MFCVQCGAQLGENAAFCHMCGAVNADEQPTRPTSNDPSYDPSKIEDLIVDVMLCALEMDLIDEDEMAPISGFVLDELESVKNLADEVAFLERLSKKWPMYLSLYLDVSSAATEPRFDNFTEVTALFESLASSGLVDSRVCAIGSTLYQRYVAKDQPEYQSQAQGRYVAERAEPSALEPGLAAIYDARAFRHKVTSFLGQDELDKPRVNDCFATFAKFGIISMATNTLDLSEGLVSADILASLNSLPALRRWIEQELLVPFLQALGKHSLVPDLEEFEALKARLGELFVRVKLGEGLPLK